MTLKSILLSGVVAALMLGSAGRAPGKDNEPMVIVVSVPGPRNLTYLPVDLITKIGADKAEGASVKVNYFGGGGIALQELMTRNADFAVAGLPAAMSQRANGNAVVALAAVSGAPLFVLMVRADLAGKVKTVADLKGKVLGVNTSSLSSKTTSQQLAELVLKTNGVSLDTVRFIPAGQSWDSQSTMLRSRMADAVMGDEPFASRLLAANEVFFLLNSADPEAAKGIPGAGFLHAALETRADLVRTEPAKAEKMVKIIRRTLQWIAKATPEQMVDALASNDAEEKGWLLAALKKYPKMYSPDGGFSSSQLRETELFFRESSPAAARKFHISELVDDRWAGRRN
jgi:NitT/TauT family transport system substrate-binding protein